MIWDLPQHLLPLISLSSLAFSLPSSPSLHLLCTLPPAIPEGRRGHHLTHLLINKTLRTALLQPVYLTAYNLFITSYFFKDLPPPKLQLPSHSSTIPSLLSLWVDGSLRCCSDCLKSALQKRLCLLLPSCRPLMTPCLAAFAFQTPTAALKSLGHSPASLRAVLKGRFARS